jgi:hypothetical protein
MATLEDNEVTSLTLAAEDCPPEQFSTIHRFSHFENRLIRSLIAHGPVLLRGGRGSGKSALLIEADRQIQEKYPQVFSVYVSLRHLPLLRSEGRIYEKIFCEILFTELQKRLNDIGFPDSIRHRPSDAGALRQLLSQLASSINRRIVLIFDDAAHIGRETALTEFFDIFRTISSSVVSCKAAIYPGVTRFGVRFDVYNDATVLDVARDERTSEFGNFFSDVMQARFPALADRIKNTRGRLNLKTASELLGRSVVGNMRAFVYACAWLAERNRAGLPDVRDVLLRLSSDYYWPLLDEVAPKLGPYQVLITPCGDIAETLFTHMASTDSASATVHRDIVQKAAKLFEILEYIGFISRREASRAMKSGGRGPRYSFNLAMLLEKRFQASLTFDQVEIWLYGNIEPAEFHSSGNQLPFTLPDIDDTADLAVFELPVNSLLQGRTYPYGLTVRQVQLLADAGYGTIKDLAEADDEELTSIDGIGKKTLHRIRGVVGQAIWM